MAVDATGLRADLLTLFQAPPATRALCGTDWGNAVGDYAAGVVPISTTVAAAAAVLGTSMASAFALTPVATLAAALDTAFVTFGTSVFGGMVVPAPPNAAPVAPPGWAAQLAIEISTHELAADAYRDLINDWFTSSGWT